MWSFTRTCWGNLFLGMPVGAGLPCLCIIPCRVGAQVLVPLCMVPQGGPCQWHGFWACLCTCLCTCPCTGDWVSGLSLWCLLQRVAQTRFPLHRPLCSSEVFWGPGLWVVQGHLLWVPWVSWSERDICFQGHLVLIQQGSSNNGFLLPPRRGAIYSPLRGSYPWAFPSPRLPISKCLVAIQIFGGLHLHHGSSLCRCANIGGEHCSVWGLNPQNGVSTHPPVPLSL